MRGEVKVGNIAAEQPGLHLLVCRQHSQIDRRSRVTGEWNRTRQKAAIISPVETDPWAALPRLVLQMGCLIEFFIMVDAENASGCGRGCACSADLWKEESCGHLGWAR